PTDRQRRTEGLAPGHPDGRAEAHEEGGRSRHEEYTDRSRGEPVDEPPRGKEEDHEGDRRRPPCGDRCPAASVLVQGHGHGFWYFVHDRGRDRFFRADQS